MFVKNIDDCPEFTANDGCQLREWLHPKNDPIDLPYSISTARIETGQRSLKHKLDQAEVYLITAGSGYMYVDGEQKSIKTGDMIFIKPQSAQWVENTSEDLLEFIVIVSPPWTAEGDIRLE